jgi:hypothetical protein
VAVKVYRRQKTIKSKRKDGKIVKRAHAVFEVEDYNSRRPPLASFQRSRRGRRHRGDTGRPNKHRPSDRREPDRCIGHQLWPRNRAIAPDRPKPGSGRCHRR